MLPYKVNDRVNIRFDSGDFIQAMITKIEGEQYLCVALSVGGGYKQGDILYCTPEQMNKTSRLMSVVSHYVLADRVDFLKEQFVKKYIKKQKAEDYGTRWSDLKTHGGGDMADVDENGKLDSKKFDELWMKIRYKSVFERANRVFTALEELDTSPNHQYLGWVCKIFLNGNLDFEDFQKTKLYLTELFKLKLAGKVQGFDINTINSIPELYNAIKKDAELGGFGILGLAKNEAEEKILNEHATKVWENENWVVFTPDTYEASCILGENTNWCTATKDYPNQYKNHTAQGKLWIAINKENPNLKFQHHFESNQFKDASDREVNKVQMREKYSDLMEGLFGTVEKHYTSGKGEDSLKNYINYIERSKGGSVISKEKVLQIMEDNTTIDENGEKHINLKFDEDTIDYIEKNIPEVIDDALANSFIASPQIENLSTIKKLFENHNIKPESYQDVLNEKHIAVDYSDNSDFPRETAIVDSLLSKGLLDKETLMRIANKSYPTNRTLLAIKGHDGEILSDDEANSLFGESSDVKYVKNQLFFTFDNGIYIDDNIDDTLNTLGSDSFRNAVKYVMEGDIDYWYNFSDSSEDYGDLINNLSDEHKKELEYYVQYILKENEVNFEEEYNNDYGEAIKDDDYLEELKDAMGTGWSRAYETGYSDALWEEIKDSIRNYFDTVLTDERGSIIGGSVDLDDIEDWERKYVDEYGGFAVLIRDEKDSKGIDGDYDDVYPTGVEKLLDESIMNTIWGDISDWEKVIKTMPKEKKKVKQKPKKVGGILNMNDVLSEYLGEKTALDYRMGDEPQLFENTNKGVVFVGGDLMGVNVEGNREPYSIDWLQANKMWAVRQLQGATKLKNLALKGVDVIVFVAYKKLLGGMASNPAFKNGVDRAIIEKLSEQGLTVDEVVEKIGGEGLSDTQLQSKILKYLGLSKEQIAKDLAMDDYKDYIGRIVGVAKFSGIHTDEHRTIEHQVYPINIILENYTEVNPPLDFEEFAKDSGIGDKSLWLRLRSFALTMNVNDNPAISYLYDMAESNDHYGDVNEKVASKNNIDMNKINKITAIKEEVAETFDIKGVKKTAKRFPYVFDKHQPEWIFDRVRGIMVLDEEQLEKVGMRKKAISDESKKKYQELSSRLNQLTQQYANGDESVKSEIDKLKTEMDNLYTNNLDKKNKE